MVELSTLTIETIFTPFSFAISIASSVSAVSPDCDTQIIKLLSVRKDIVAGICLSNMNINGVSKIVPNVYDFDHKESYRS